MLGSKLEKSQPKRRGFPFVLFFVTCFCVWFVFASLHPRLPQPNEPPRLYSNQVNLDLRLTLLRAIKGARESIFLVMFGLSDPSILSALSKKTETLPVSVYYDMKGSSSLRKKLFGGTLHPVRGQGLMHQKILVLDDSAVFIGSANFTEASIKMHDNLVLGFLSPKIARFLKEKAPHTSGHLRTMVGGQDIELWLLPDPKGHALTEIRKKIRGATRSIRAALFTFTHETLKSELIQARRRGVDVTVLIDLYSGIGASAETVEGLKKAGIKVLFSQGGPLLHHKFALIDEQTLITGSANWTKSAFLKNSDCLLFLHNMTHEQKGLMKKLWSRLENQGKKR